MHAAARSASNTSDSEISGVNVTHSRNFEFNYDDQHKDYPEFSQFLESSRFPGRSWNVVTSKNFGHPPIIARFLRHKVANAHGPW